MAAIGCVHRRTAMVAVDVPQTGVCVRIDPKVEGVPIHCDRTVSVAPCDDPHGNAPRKPAVIVSA